MQEKNEKNPLNTKSVVKKHKRKDSDEDVEQKDKRENNNRLYTYYYVCFKALHLLHNFLKE